MLQGDLYLYHALSLDQGWQTYGTRHYPAVPFFQFLLFDQRLYIVTDI
jgi:hypothetical protein